MNPRIYISQSDAARLKKLLAAPSLLQTTDNSVCERLGQELGRAEIVPDAELPEDVVALNSRAELENLDDGDIEEYTLVLPAEADIDRGRVSVLAPLGAGMLGFKTGDKFEWATPAGKVSYRVRSVTQSAYSNKPELVSQILSRPA